MGFKREPNNVLNLFEKSEYITVCAPMVRYSKIQFRSLVRQYNCDLCFSPMIMANSFCRSENARVNEFSTNISDCPTIVQFATNKSKELVEAAKLVSPYCDGVDLNCGCPQRWAKQLGIGCVMLDDPQQIYEIVRECRNQILKPFTVSVKMRLLKDIRKTVEICRQLERSGASFITLHGRTPSQQKGSANIPAIKLLIENVNCPVIANGGITNLQECEEMYAQTHCNGIMAANGLLTNPTLFSGTEKTTIECVQSWLNICYNSTLTPDQYSKLYSRTQPSSTMIPERPLNLTFQCFHHHLVFMLEKILPRYKRRVFNGLQTFESTLNFLETHLGLTYKLFDPDTYKANSIINLNYSDANDSLHLLKDIELESDMSKGYYSLENDGKYFQTKVSNSDSDDECYFDIFSENG